MRPRALTAARRTAASGAKGPGGLCDGAQAGEREFDGTTFLWVLGVIQSASQQRDGPGIPHAPQGTDSRSPNSGIRRQEAVADSRTGRNVAACRETVDHPDLLLRWEVGQFGGEYSRSVTGSQGAHLGDGDRFEDRVRTVQDLEYALLALVLIQAKQRVEGAAANIGWLGWRDELLVN